MGYLSYFESGVGNHEVVEFSNFDLDYGKTQRGNECWYLVFPNLHFSNSLLPFDASRIHFYHSMRRPVFALGSLAV